MSVNRKKKENSDQEMSYSVQVKRAHEFDDSNDIGIDMVVNGVTIYGCIYKSGTNKDGEEYTFVSFPSRKGKDGKYYNFAYFKIDDDLLKDIENQIEKLL